MELISLVQLLPAPLAILFTMLSLFVLFLKKNHEEFRTSLEKQGERIGKLEQYQAVDDNRFESLEKQLEDIKETNREILQEIKQLHQEIYKAK